MFHAAMAAQVIGLCERKEPAPKFIVADTPGQIEIFTWSASGQIVTEAFASTFPTVVLFVVDTPRCLQPKTFMSNMLQVRCALMFSAKCCLSAAHAAFQWIQLVAESCMQVSFDIEPMKGDSW